MRWLLALLVLVMAMSISGISSAMVASMGDDCCADGSSDELPTDGREACPPFCHACACSPAFAVPSTTVPVLAGGVERAVVSDRRSQPPESPPLPGVFHPPRR